MNFPAKGELDGTSFIDLLKDAAQDSLTGIIRLENESVVKVVYIQKGAVSFASSNEKTDRLTEVLKRAGKLTPEQVEDAQARLKPKVSIGKTLVELGYITPRDLLWGARAQVDSILHHMLFWTQGKYQVQQGNLPKEIIHLNLPISTIIFEGIMKTQNREWILQHIGSPDAIYELASDFHKQNETMRLPVNEVASHLNGKRSLHDIAEKSEIDTFEICKTVVALECLGLAHAIQDAPLQMDLTTPDAEPEPPHEILQDVEPPMEAVSEGQELGQVVSLPAVQDLQTEPVKAEQPEKIEAQPVTAEAPQEQQAPEEAPPEMIKTPELEEPQASPQSMPQPDEGVVLTRERDVRWKTPVTAILVIVAVALAIFLYLQHQESPPAEQENQASNQTTRPRPLTHQKPTAAPPIVKEPEGQPVVPELPPDSPIRLLQEGKTNEAAQAWRKSLSKRNFGYTIQLVIACQEKTVQDTYQLLGRSKEIIVLPVNYKGQDCYRVVYGQFRAREYAQTAIRSLPEVFLKQPSPPTVIGFSKIL